MRGCNIGNGKMKGIKVYLVPFWKTVLKVFKRLNTDSLCDSQTHSKIMLNRNVSVCSPDTGAGV